MVSSAPTQQLVPIPVRRPVWLEIVHVSPSTLFPKRSDGQLRQTAFLLARSSVKETRAAVLRLELGGNTVESLEVSLQPGDNRITLAIPDILAPTPISVSIHSPDHVEASWKEVWYPQRKWKVYIVKSSHYDLGYDGRIDAMQNDAAAYLDLAKRLCTDRDQLHAWHYYLEHMRFIRAYEAERSETALRDLVVNYLKAGAMTLLGNPGGPHFHWMDYEQMARASYPARREMADRFGLDVSIVSVVDNPSASWSAYQAFAQAGFRYLLRFGQGFRGPGSLRELGAPRIAWMQGPNGKDRILCSFHDCYGEDFWLGDGGTYGANFIEEASHRISERLLRLEAGECGPYPYDALIVPNYVDWEIPHENERALARWKSDFHYPELHLDEAAAGLRHIEQHFADRIPVIAGDTNNNSGDYSSIDPRSQGLKRRTTRLLAFAEGLNALASAAEATHAYPGKLLNDQYIDLVEYDEHCWPTMLEATDVNIFNTCVTKAHSVKRVAERVAGFLDAPLRILGGSDPSLSCTGVTVWNSLGHPRTDLVHCEAPPEFDGGLVDVQTGEEIPLQKTGKNFQFVAKDVPPYGFRRYRFAATLPDAEKGGEGFEAAENEETLSLKNRWYRLTFDKREGRVVGLYSFLQERELLDQECEHGLNDWLRCHTAPFSYSSSPKDLNISRIGRGTARIVEKGAVSAVLEVRTVDEALGVAFTTRYALHSELDHLDIVNNVERADFLHTPATQRYSENVFVSFPWRIPGAEFRVEYSPGVLDPARDFFASNTDFVIANRWLDVSGEGGGVTVVPHEAPTVHLGQINYNKFQSRFQASSSHLYSYAWSNRMSGLITLGPEDFQATLSYSIRAHAGDWREGEAPGFGWRQASPLLAIADCPSARERKAAHSFLSLDNPHVQVVVVKRAERPGDGHVIRLVETSGIDHEGISVTLDIGEVESAWLCDGVENDHAELAVQDNCITLPLGRFDVATVRIRSRGPALPSIVEVACAPRGDSEVEITWKTESNREPGSSCGYHVYRSEDPEAPPTLHTLVGYVEGTVYRDTGLKPGTHYVYHVASATRNNLQGPVSAPVSVRTTLDNRTAPAPVRDLDVVPLDQDRLAVYWRRSLERDIAHYEVHRSSQPDFHAGGDTRIETVSPTRLEYLIYEDGNVRGGETWYYRVFPVDLAGNVQIESRCVFGRAPTMRRFPSKRNAS